MTAPSNVLPLRQDSEHEYAAWIDRQVPERFHADAIPPDPLGLYSYPPCLVPQCDRVSAKMPERLCRPHSTQRRQQAPDLPVAKFVRQAKPSPVGGRSQDGDAARGIFRMTLVGNPVVRSELALGLSLRAQPEAGAPLRASAFNALARALDDLRIRSVLEVPPDSPLQEQLARRCGSSWGPREFF
jgi:hypothetical protein